MKLMTGIDDCPMTDDDDNAERRGRRTGVQHLGNTAGLGTFPGSGTARGTWAGPLVLSPSES